MSVHKSPALHRRYLAFAACWCLSLALGTLFAVGADSSVLSLMRRTACSSVSIVPLLLTAFLPFLIAAYAVTIHQYGILLLVCACRCFAYGYVAGLAVQAFGSSCWLVQPMLQFTDGLTLFLLCLGTIRWYTGCLERVKRDLAVCMVVAVAVVIVDFLAVSPYLAMLLDS